MFESIGETPEASPLWPLVTILGEIASRIERRRPGEQASSVPSPVPPGTKEPAGVEPAGNEGGR